VVHGETGKEEMKVGAVSNDPVHKETARSTRRGRYYKTRKNSESNAALELVQREIIVPYEEGETRKGNGG